MTEARAFQRPNAAERLLNRAVGVLVRLGLAPAHMRLLEVRGRRTGRRYTLPVDLLVERDRLYLVAPRGATQWVRNVEVTGEVTLRRGRERGVYRARPLSPAEKPAVLKAYLDRFRREVQRYFPVRAGSSVEAFVPLTHRYPAFELLPAPAAARSAPP